MIDGLDLDAYRSRVHVAGPADCWPWTSARQTHGYGTVQAGAPGRRRSLLAHRVAFMLETDSVVGPDVHICHRCDNPPCCNPAHLFAGNAAVNAADKSSKGRARGARGEKHRSARLTEDQVVAIRRRAAGGERQSDLAIEYRVSSTSIWQVVHRIHWAHVEGGQ